MLTDSHCHLDRINLDAFDGKMSNLLAAAQEQGVGQFLCVCIDLEHFEDVHSIAASDERVWCSVGVHPTSDEGRDPEVEDLLQLADSEQVIAIGETGLDYFHMQRDEVEWQRERFRRHIRAAVELQKPLIIHTRSANEDTIKILQEEGAEQAGGIMHCFAEDWDTASKALDLGFYISFSGIITFKNAEELRSVLKQVPDEALLVETDAPYLAPVPHRGKMNHPAYVRHVAEKMAEVRESSPDDIASLTTGNFNRLFKLS
ncbi:MAG: TatD family hydrolase [Gammaproteobacteria bacterium]|nr:TatD family hydrolase [Gammaproteobacteria bacterium]